MLDFLVELIGTFIFLSVIIITGDPIAVGVALTAMIYFGRKVSGGHFNPAVSIMFWLDNKMSTSKTLCQIVAQISGASLAYLYYKNMK